MLGTGARYAEYGITGGFFLLSQALIFGFAFPDTLVWGADRFLRALLSESVSKIPELARPAIQSLLVALALLSVFIIGLVLEIIGSVFMLYEASIYRKRLVMNPWITKFVEAELPDYAEDYGLFLDLANVWSQWKEEWKPKNWFRRGPSWGVKWQRQVQQRFRRLESVLIAKVLTSGAKTEMLAEQISICRMSRAIGTALYVVSFELIMGSGPFAEILPAHLNPGYLGIIGFLILGCATLITLGAYSRFANMLLALVYAGWKPKTAPLAESRGERDET
jgi:hypothetical protein